jgi:hypothetical protein
LLFGQSRCSFKTSDKLSHFLSLLVCPYAPLKTPRVPKRFVLTHLSRLPLPLLRLLLRLSLLLLLLRRLCLLRRAERERERSLHSNSHNSHQIERHSIVSS